MMMDDDLLFSMDEVSTPESGISTSSTVSSNMFFAGIEIYETPATPTEADDDDIDDFGPQTPTTVQVSHI